VTDERQPVADDEFILRRIHKNCITAGIEFPVQRVAFEPNSKDLDGISLYRLKIISTETLAFSGRQPGEYYIASLSVALLRSSEFGLTIDPTLHPDPNQPRGHCSIRELNFSAKKSSKALQIRLAELASRNVVYVPTGCSL
jgi:hypothetical protein